MIDICEKSLCTGCHACYNICGKKAISMKPDNLGFLYPQIDASLCVDCRLCVQICPVNHPPKSLYPDSAYAVQSKDLNDLMTSTSGGAASVFSQYILSLNGVVYGCSNKDIFHICHKRIDNISDLSELKGSKYVQSQIGNIFVQIKGDLIARKMVLFIGTPCQVAGLKNYLRKDYDNLLMVDLVCHGVPSQKILKDELSSYRKDLRGSYISFRRKGKTKAASKYGIYIKKNGCKIYEKNYPHGYFMMGFMRGLFFRNSCYSCHWSAPERCSDITIGDFWGLGKLQNLKIKRENDISEVLLNTGKGIAFFDRCKDLFYYEKREVQEAIKGNGQLQKPSKRHSLYYQFQELYPQLGFAKSCSKCLHKDYLNYYKQEYRNKIVFLLDNIPFARRCYKAIKHIVSL